VTWASRVSMRLLISLAVVLCVLLVLVPSAEAYRKRKGRDYKTPFWQPAPEDDLKVETLTRVKDCHRKARPGDILKVHYTGALREGNRIFDSSVARGEPFEFQLGGGRVIAGWEQGLIGMCVGEKRRLTVPPSLGYGSRGAGGSIPPNAYLLFGVELLELRSPDEPAKPTSQ